MGKKSENHLYSDLNVHEKKAQSEQEPTSIINTKTTFKIVFTLTWTFMKNSANRARAEAWTTKTKHSRGKTLQRNNKEILSNNISGAQKVL